MSFTISASNECRQRSETISVEVECECKLVIGLTPWWELKNSRIRIVYCMLSKGKQLARESWECLHAKGKFLEVDAVIQEYVEFGHAERELPSVGLDKKLSDTYYLPVHMMYKHSSTTTKTRTVLMHQPNHPLECCSMT